MSLHPALGPIGVSSRRHSSAPHSSELRSAASSRRTGTPRLKPLVLTPARTVSTPLTTSSKARRTGSPPTFSPSRRYSAPLAPRMYPQSPSLGAEISEDYFDPVTAPVRIRRRSIGYRRDSPGEAVFDTSVVKRSGSTSSESTAYSSDFSRRGSADTCDTDISTPSSSPEKISYPERNRLPSLQNRFDPHRGLSLDVVLETDDDSFEAPRVPSGEPEDRSRYRAFWSEEAARNESAFQDVCVALDELAPAFPTSSLLSSRSFTASASPLSRSASSMSDDSSSGRASRRGKPIVIKPAGERLAAAAEDERRSRRISRIRLSQAIEAGSQPALPPKVKASEAGPATALSEKPSVSGPVSSAELAKVTPKRVPRPLVWPPPNETKRLSLAPAFAYDSGEDTESFEDSDAELDEKAEMPRRAMLVPRPPRTRKEAEAESGDFLDFLLTEAPSEPNITSVHLDEKSSTRQPSDTVTARRSDSAPAPPVANISPRSKGFASRLFSSFSGASQPKHLDATSKQLKKRPTSFMARSKSATATPAPVRPRPLISGPLELEATQNALHTSSSRESFGSVSTTSLGQAQRSRSASVEARLVPISPTAVTAFHRSTEHDSAAEEVLSLYTQNSPSSPSASAKSKTSRSVPSSPSGAGKQLPATPLLLSPLWALPVTDLPRNPLAWAERSLHRSPSMSSVVTNDTTVALIESYA
ncbi:hypothetical protein JCM10908_004371 [Rhodotorula pacifica]|uniref:uncharacterized protein n=1 Tax=Rhodotorula pacifica TaxID=1495444 RepID=UPI003175B3EC